MRLPSDQTRSWPSRRGSRSQGFGTGSDEYELYEEDGEFILTVEMPGFEPDDIEVAWYEGRLTIAAEREDERREQERTYRRTFRMPKRIADDNIRARYRNGILDVYLPSIEDATTKGKTIPIES